MELREQYTAEQFIEELLPLVKDQNWEKIPVLGEILRNEKGACPICAVASELGLNSSNETFFPWYTDFVRQGYINEFTLDEIVDAADDNDDAIDTLRQAMIKILNPDELFY